MQDQADMLQHRVQIAPLKRGGKEPNERIGEEQDKKQKTADDQRKNGQRERL